MQICSLVAAHPGTGWAGAGAVRPPSAPLPAPAPPSVRPPRIEVIRSVNADLSAAELWKNVAWRTVQAWAGFQLLPPVLTRLECARSRLSLFSGVVPQMKTSTWPLAVCRVRLAMSPRDMFRMQEEGETGHGTTQTCTGAASCCRWAAAALRNAVACSGCMAATHLQAGSLLLLTALSA